MSKITRSAKGKHCTLRVSGYGGCSDPETVVLCHAPCAGKGMSYKSGTDWFGAFGCQKCHDLIDDRRKLDYGIRSQRYLLQAEKDEAWLRGIYETQSVLISEGLINVCDT